MIAFSHFITFITLLVFLYTSPALSMHDDLENGEAGEKRSLLIAHISSSERKISINDEKENYSSPPSTQKEGFNNMLREEDHTRQEKCIRIKKVLKVAIPCLCILSCLGTGIFLLIHYLQGDEQTCLSCIG